MGWSGFRWGGVLTSSEAARFGVSRVRKTLPMGTQSSWSFRHHHITGDEQTIAKANRLKGALEQLACRYGTEMCQPVIAREGHKMKITGLLVSHKRRGHNRSSYSHISPKCGAPHFQMWASRRRGHNRSSDSHISPRCEAPQATKYGER